MDDPDNRNNQPDDLERHARSIVGLIGDDRQDKALLDRVHHLISHGSHSHEYIRERIYLAELIALDRIASAVESIGDLLEDHRARAAKLAASVPLDANGIERQLAITLNNAVGHIANELNRVRGAAITITAEVRVMGQREATSDEG